MIYKKESRRYQTKLALGYLKDIFLKLADANSISTQNYLMPLLASGNPGHW
jgi:hypothetical protein